MLIAETPKNEEERLRHLKELNILDTIEEQAYDDLTFLAAQICNTKIALISLLDEKRQWFKSHHGLDARETDREISFCSHAILEDELFIVEDTHKDVRFNDNPLVSGEPKLRFYAGAPLMVEQGVRIGTLCVLDSKTCHLSESQQTSLEALARQVVSLLTLRLKIKELKQLDDVKDEFISMVSHELRSPLTSLKGSLDIMNHLEPNLNEQIKPMMDVAVRNAGRLLVIVNDILDLASMEAGKLKMNMGKVNIVALLQDAIELNEPYIMQYNCKFTVDLSGEVKQLHVHGDHSRLLQVVSNLIVNAAKFSPKTGGNIEVVVQQIEQNIQVSIIDNGKGISESSKDKVFTKFHQLETLQNQKLPGTGLGLNICKHIIEAHDGEIGFNSVPNKRTEFYFKLKLID